MTITINGHQGHDHYHHDKHDDVTDWNNYNHDPHLSLSSYELLTILFYLLNFLVFLPFSAMHAPALNKVRAAMRLRRGQSTLGGCLSISCVCLLFRLPVQYSHAVSNTVLSNNEQNLQRTNSSHQDVRKPALPLFTAWSTTI